MTKLSKHTFRRADNDFEVVIQSATEANLNELKQVHRFGRITGDAHVTPDYALARFTNPDYYKKWADNLFNSKTAVLKATSNSTIVGFAVGGGADEGDGYDELAETYSNLGELHQIYVVPGLQNSGTGTALYKTLMQDMHKMGYENVVINMLTGNETARQFYQRMGARKTHEFEEMKSDEPVSEPIKITCDLMLQSDIARF